MKREWISMATGRTAAALAIATAAITSAQDFTIRMKNQDGTRLELRSRGSSNARRAQLALAGTDR
jgi:hypothetical protein